MNIEFSIVMPSICCAMCKVQEPIIHILNVESSSLCTHDFAMQLSMTNREVGFWFLDKWFATRRRIVVGIYVRISGGNISSTDIGIGLLHHGINGFEINGIWWHTIGIVVLYLLGAATKHSIPVCYWHECRSRCRCHNIIHLWWFWNIGGLIVRQPIQKQCMLRRFGAIVLVGQ